MPEPAVVKAMPVHWPLRRGQPETSIGDFSVAGSELKELVKLAKLAPAPFAFSPGGLDDQAYCGMHRAKQPAVIGKEAEEERDSKFAFGMATVSGKDVRLTCERQLLAGEAVQEVPEVAECDAERRHFF